MTKKKKKKETNQETDKEKKERIHEMFVEFDKTRDPEIREKLITEHLYIAEILAKKYVNRGIDYDDLLQVASLGLIYAVDRFDVNKGFAFSSFATPTIVGEIKRYFRDKGWVIRVPRRIQELSKKINLVRSNLTQELQKQPTVDDIAEKLEVTPEEVLEAMEASQVYTPQSLDKTFDSSMDDRDTSLGDIIGIEDENFDQIDMYDLVRRLMEHLNEVEKKILIYRFYDKRTQISIAEELDVSQMTVSRLEKKIIQKFRDILDIQPEEDKKNKKKTKKTKRK